MSNEATVSRRRWSLVVGLTVVVGIAVLVSQRWHSVDRGAVEEAALDDRVGAGERPQGGFANRAASLGIDKALLSGGQDRHFIFESLGTGCAVFDFDGDGLLDLFVVNAGRSSRQPGDSKRVQLIDGPGSTLYRQRVSGRFEDVTDAAGLRFTGWGVGAAVGDIENDGDLDLLVTVFGANRLYVNGGDGRFTERGATAGVDHTGLSTSAVFFDYDDDGLLDLYVTNYVVFDLSRPPNDAEPCLERGVPVSCSPPLHEPAPDVLFRNLGDGRFRDVTTEAGLGDQEGAYGLGVVAADVNRDGAVDLYVANDTTPNFLWLNQGDGTFIDETYFSGAGVSENGQGQAGMGVDSGDANGDGWPDLYVTNFSLEPNAFYENVGDGTFADGSYRSGLARASFRYLGWGTKFFDYDLDGRLDLVVANGHVYPRVGELESGMAFQQPCLLFRGDDNGFVDVTGKAGGDLGALRNHRGLATGDLNQDGAVDLVITTLDSPPLVLFNEVLTTESRRAIGFVLAGTRSNSEGIGARIEIETEKGFQSAEVSRGGSYLSSSDAQVVFGIGAEKRVRSVLVLWPSGTKQKLGTLEGSGLYHLEEGGEVQLLRTLRRGE